MPYTDNELNLHGVRARTIDRFCRDFGVGRTKVFEAIKNGEIEAVKFGGRTLITSDAAERWLKSLPKVQRENLED